MRVRASGKTSAAWKGLVSRWRKISLMERTCSLLVWDQSVTMPSSASDERADQLSVLAENIHELRSDKAYGDILQDFSSREFCDESGQPLTDFERRSVCLALEEFRKGQSISSDLVARQSALRSRTQTAWAGAKQQGSFGDVRPLLEELVQVTREVASSQRQALPGVADDTPLYDIMLEEYSRGFGTKKCTEIFNTFDKRLSGHVKEFNKNQSSSSSSVNIFVDPRQPFQVEKQKALGQRIVRHVFSDPALRSQVRLDESAHPFSIRIASQDARITTRYNTHDLSSGMMGTLHECGHALYELGLPKARTSCSEDASATDGGEDITHYPAASYLDVAAHESQSLFWERCIGQSEAFAQWLAPNLWQNFAYGRWDDSLRSDFPRAIHRSLNAPSSTPIRVEADAMAYPLHVKVRFQVERDLIEGRIQVADLPHAWDAAYQDTLGITIADPAHGVLQDVHFYAGMFGYFPSYTLGAVLAFQLWDQCQEALGGDQATAAIVASGEWAPIVSWLRDNVHRYGRMDTNALEMCGRISFPSDSPSIAPPDLINVEKYCDHLIAASQFK